jgi:uncharacterized protein (TIGR02611 family)
MGDSYKNNTHGGGAVTRKNPRDDESTDTPDVGDVVGYVADAIRHEAVLSGTTTDPDPSPQLVDPTGYKGRWQARFARWRLRARHSAARSRSQVLAWRHKMNETAVGRIGVKLAVAAVGTLVIAIGVILLPLPGPGWVIVFAGLAILAVEFHWARRLLIFGREQLRRWTGAMRRGSWPLRIASTLALVVVLAFAAWVSARVAFGIDLTDVLSGG